jgi:uncharacterized circularly permuted ATP-grasp superfamily protein
VPRAGDLSHVLANLEELVVKEVHGAGGYGMLVGPCASREELAFSRAAQGAAGQLHRPADAVPVHLPDLRRRRHRPAPHRPAPLRAHGAGAAPGTGRPDPVALTEGSLVVNSSQGGGTKDTWVMEGSPC